MKIFAHKIKIIIWLLPRAWKYEVNIYHIQINIAWHACVHLPIMHFNWFGLYPKSYRFQLSTDSTQTYSGSINFYEGKIYLSILSFSFTFIVQVHFPFACLACHWPDWETFKVYGLQALKIELKRAGEWGKWLLK